MRKTSAYARRRWAPDPLASLRLLDRARPFDAGDTTEQHIKTRACFERLADGTADNDDFDRVAMAIKSSPRPWGCFQPEALRLAALLVFPTPVGVFLRRSPSS